MYQVQPPRPYAAALRRRHAILGRLYGEAPVPLERSTYPTIGAGVHFVIKPEERMIVNFEYAQGTGDSRGVYLKLGYAW